MVKRTRTPKNRHRRTTKQKASQKKTYFVGLVVISIVLVGILGYTLYRLFSSRNTHPPILPSFETYPTQTVESQTKEIDQCIYDALLGLNIPVGNVAFKAVEAKRDHGELWEFSELDILIPTSLPHSQIREVFLTRLSKRKPKRSIRFTSGSQQELILDISFNGHHTHRLVFYKVSKKESTPKLRPSLPKVAIIIDDLGYDEKLASKFLHLNGVMSFSVLPHSPFQKTIASTIHQSGRDLLLHLPMEPLEYPEVDPGAGALFSSMQADVLLGQLRRDLDAVPFAIGVNNHMGSSLTQDPAKMRQIFTILKKRNLFFVDSLTSPRSCCQQTAHLLKLKFAERHVFLDHSQEPSAIRFQMKRLIGVARRHGKAIGIGHPYPTTWEVLKAELPNLGKQAELVRVSELVR